MILPVGRPRRARSRSPSASASSSSKLEADAVGKLTVSTGIAVGPGERSEPARARRMRRGRDDDREGARERAHRPFDESDRERPVGAEVRRDDVRSIAHLKMLQSLSGKLSRLNDVAQIGLTISDELRLLDRLPQLPRLPPRGGRPRAGRVPRRPHALVTGRSGEAAADAASVAGSPAASPRRATAPRRGRGRSHEFGEQIAGTAEIEESLLAVPLRYGRARDRRHRASPKLGLDQFDADDLRLLEVLAGHASVALENARLYEAAAARGGEREGAPRARARSRRGSAASPTWQSASSTGAASILASPSTSGLAAGRAGRRARVPRRLPERDDTRRGAHAHPRRVPRAVAHAPASRSPSSRADYAADRAGPDGTEGRFAIAPVRRRRSLGRRRGGASPPKSDHDDREPRAPGEHRAPDTARAADAQRATRRSSARSSPRSRRCANALEANDEYTSSHARWITDLALRGRPGARASRRTS